MKKLIWLTLLLAIPAYPAAKIVDSGIAANAAIQRSKTASGTAYRILANGADGVMGENAAITADRAVASDSNGQLVASVATANELGYLSGVSSALQTQLDAKQALDGDLTAIAALTGTDTIYYRCGASTWCPVVVSTGLNFSSGTLEASGTASPLTTKGDIYVFGSANDRLPIGTNGYQLVADSTQTLGVKWAAPASGSSITKDYNISSHGFSVGDILNCTSTTSCTKSKADSEANSEISGMVSSVADTDHFTLTQIGYVTGLPTMTADEVEFLSDVTAGAMQNTAPTDLNHVNCPVFKSDSTTSGYFHAQRCFTVPAVSGGGDSCFTTLYGNSLGVGGTNSSIALFSGSDSIGACMTGTNDAANGSYITINESGTYSCRANMAAVSGAAIFNLNVESTLNNTVQTTYANGMRCQAYSAGTNQMISCSASEYMPAGKIVTVKEPTPFTTSSTLQSFNCARVN